MSSAQQIVVPRCPLCEATQAQDYARFAEFTWVRCDCGLIYKRSVATGAATLTVGGEGSFGDTGYGQRYKARLKRRVSKSIHQIRDALESVTDEALHAGSRLLDIGCSLGYTLVAARRLRLEAHGVDVSQVAVDECLGQGFEAQVAGLEVLPYPQAHFAVLTMKHVLEHTPTPQQALAEALRVLHPRGALFIAVPHAGYRGALRDPSRSRFYRPDAHGGLEHWVYYTPDTLTRLLEKNGYAVTRIHPRLWHRRATAAGRLGELLAAPWRFVFGQALTALRLRKEFWLVATPAAPAACRMRPP